MLKPIFRLLVCSTLIWNTLLIASVLRVPTNLACTPTTVDSGATVTCTVTISRPAVSRGSRVLLSSSNATLKVPPSVTVSSGLTNANFVATAGTVQTNQTTTLTATLNSSSQTATVTVLSSVTVSISPTTAFLVTNQTQQFTATVNGSSGDLGVTWSLTPNVGSISNGLYTAPGTVTSQQAITVTATSLADASKSASATITLNPSAVVSVSITPSIAALNDSRTQQFSASVTGTSNTSLNWSLNPAMGNISSSGLYTAPSMISATQTVNVTATSAADSTKSATAVVTLMPMAALAWTASSSPNVSGYNIYRGNTSGGPYSKINSSLVASTTYLDANVVKGNYYYYVATAVNSSGMESSYSGETQLLVQ